LDNLLGEHSTNPELIPHIAHFRKQQLLDLMEEDKQVVNGVETFRALPVSFYYLVFLNAFLILSILDNFIFIILVEEPAGHLLHGRHTRLNL
jgi:hypothetical protein